MNEKHKALCIQTDNRLINTGMSSLRAKVAHTWDDGPVIPKRAEHNGWTDDYNKAQRNTRKTAVRVIRIMLMCDIIDYRYVYT